MTRLDQVLAAIDDANAADPSLEPGPDGREQPAALLYGHRMTEELGQLYPDASETLRIAARGQHIERWKTPRTSYPEGRAGYLAWRRDQAGGHAKRVGELMRTAGYGDDEIATVGSLLRKEGLKSNEDTQRLEDVICFVFMRHYLDGFSAKHDRADVVRIVSKTARKMSAEARTRAASEFDLPADLAPAFAA